MASLLRQIVAGPRARHPEAGLDLCYVTDRIIATSGPSGTWPKQAYRNPLEDLKKFLNKKHGDNWAIWEFRAEGTGYPDEEVYGRIWHYPFPDHHPPPFALLPNVLASMRNWLQEDEKRVVVVHCKAGKGRSGTCACSYLVAEEGWELADALQRFTERRMRPGFGPGLSIPSQKRWLGYVDRWTKHGKMYVEQQVEIQEIRIWGMRDGVKIGVEGFVDEGRTIRLFHTFNHKEREIVRGALPPDSGFADVVTEVIRRKKSVKRKGRPVSEVLTPPTANSPARDGNPSELNSPSDSDAPFRGDDDSTEYTCDVVFRPAKKINLPTNDINIDVERRHTTAGMSMASAIAHVWFNAYFEGNGPENGGKQNSSGVFSIDFAAMDGVKGSSRKGTKAFTRMEVAWRVVPEEEGGRKSEVITQPKEGEEVKQSAPADWRGEGAVPVGAGNGLATAEAGGPAQTDKATGQSKAEDMPEESKEKAEVK